MELINSTYLTDKVVEDDNFCYRQPIEKNVKYRIRSCVSVLYDWFYKLLFFLFAKKAESRKYEISICAIFKNEAPFLKEWLEFHLMLGIDHFYLYNNNSEDDYLDGRFILCCKDEAYLKCATVRRLCSCRWCF